MGYKVGVERSAGDYICLGVVIPSSNLVDISTHFEEAKREHRAAIAAEEVMITSSLMSMLSPNKGVLLH